MSQQKPVSTAQVVDTFMQRTALGITLVAVKFGVSALGRTFPDSHRDTFQLIAIGLSILVVVAILPSFIRYVSLRRKDPQGCRNVESYMVEMFKEAALKSFSATFVLLIILQVVVAKAVVSMPVVFFLDLIMAVSLGVFAVSFFFLTRETDDDFEGNDFDSDDFDGEHEA